MPDPSAVRVSQLENQMSDVEGRLGSVGTELKDFRAEVRGEFARVRQEAAGFRAEMRGEFATAHMRMDGIERAVREAKSQMLTLHEEVISRIKTIGESHPSSDR